MAGKIKPTATGGTEKEVKKMPEEKPKAAPASSGGSEDRLLAALCYIITILVPLFVIFTDKKSNKFLAFHAWQSLLLTVVMFVVFAGLSMVVMVLTMVTGFGGICLMPVYFVPLVVFLFIAWKAYQGEKYMLPTLGEYAEKQASK